MIWLDIVGILIQIAGFYLVLHPKNFFYEELEFRWIWWTFGFFGTFLGWIVRVILFFKEKAEKKICDKKQAEENTRIWAEREKAIAEKVSQREQRVSYFINSPVTNQIVSWLKTQGTLQEIYINVKGITVLSSLGSSTYRFSQYGIADFQIPTWLEYENNVDDPYLLAMAINSWFGNEFTLKINFDYDDHWSGVSLKKPLKNF